MNAIEIKDLTKSYPGFTLDHLNLILPQGCIMGLVGENGAGKTTTIKLILNMLKKDEGSIKLYDREYADDDASFKEDIGVVLDEVGISDCLTAKQVARIMRSTFKNWEDDTYDALLKKLSIPCDKEFREFSKGMKMKLGIAIALSHKAKLLLMDEPTAGLDPIVRDEVVDMLMEFTRAEDHAVLISSHIVSDLEKSCDYIAFLHEGRLLMCEEKDRLIEEYGILNTTEEELLKLNKEAYSHIKANPYGIQALVKKEMLPQGMNVSPCTIEELFLFMVKEDK